MSDTITYQIREWSEKYENNRSRELKRIEWFALTNDLGDDRYAELIDHPDGPAHYGAYVAILCVASRCEPRGVLIRDGDRPHDAASLARLTRFPRAIIDTVIPRLMTLGLMEIRPTPTELGDTSQVIVTPPPVVTTIPQVSAGLPQAGAGLPHDAADQRLWNGMEGNGMEGKRKTPLPPPGACGASPDGDAPVGFGEWWAAYPASERKVGKSKCAREWTRKKLEPIAERVIAAIERSKTSRDWTKDAGAYIPQPLTWLNKAPWETDPADAINPKGNHGHTQRPTAAERGEYEQRDAAPIQILNGHG